MTEEELIDKFESENITLASLKKRAVAYIIDDIILSVVIVFAFYNSIVVALQDHEMLIQTLIDIAPYILGLKIAYQAIFVYLYGATLGKIAVKIRVIYLLDANRPNLFTSLIRSIARVVNEMLYFVGFFWAIKDNKKQTWHDIAAKTLVVNA